MRQERPSVYLLGLQEAREKRESRNMAAKALGIHPQHLYNIEKQRAGISLTLALRCVQRYGALRLLSNEDGRIYLLQEEKLPEDANICCNRGFER